MVYVRSETPMDEIPFCCAECMYCRIRGPQCIQTGRMLDSHEAMKTFRADDCPLYEEN